ncbi:MAG: thioredoxin family protein [Acidobacteriota bacterium]|nr:thioredoxin family protein [Acidobacteriota bacterium]
MTTKRALLIAAGVVAALALVVAVVAGSIVGFAFYTLDHSAAAQTAKAFLRQNEKLRGDIGDVRGFGYFTTGSMNAQGALGNAELRMKTIGATKTVNATVVLATREGRDWRVVDAYYDDPTGRRIYLTRNFDDPGAQADRNAAEAGDEDEAGDANSEDANSKDDDSREGGESAAGDGEARRFDEGSFKANVLDAKSPVLVVLSSAKSADGRALDETMRALAPRYEERVDLVEYDLDDQPALRRRFDVKADPTVIIFKGGREQERRAGRVSAEELSRLLDKYIDK